MKDQRAATVRERNPPDENQTPLTDVRGSLKSARRIRATSYPDAEDFAARNVLKPPSEQEMLDLFIKAGLI